VFSRATALTVLAAGATLAAAAPASAVTRTVTTFRTTIDVDLSLTEKSHWQGIREGCFAPAENFDATYEIDIDSTPKGKASKVRAGGASILNETHGASTTFGDVGSFRQRMVSAPWELQTAYPPGADCGPDPAPAPPPWATSPTCKPVSERVLASLIPNSGTAEDGSTVGGIEGSLLLTRGRKASVASPGGTMGARCLRTLHAIDGVGRESEIAIGLRSTFIQVPVPGLRSKLLKLAKGGKDARPSFTIEIRVGGDCNAMTMKPSIGPREDFVRTPFSQPMQALGAFNGEQGRTACLISGTGRAVVRRVSPAARTTFSTP